MQGIFLQAVKSIGELLVRICSDAETENNLIEAMQIAIRSQHNTMMNILVWEIILLVRLQLTKEIWEGHSDYSRSAQCDTKEMCSLRF